MRNTIQRDLVYEVVGGSCDHPTAETVYHRAKQKMPSISLGTVYRNLSLLSDLKKIRRIGVDGGSDRFDKTVSTHAHLSCEVCGSVVDVGKTDLLPLLKQMSEEQGFDAYDADLMLYGICTDCVTAKNAK